MNHQIDFYPISKFRSAMRANGIEITFSQAAKILVDSGICELSKSETGYVISREFIEKAHQSLNGQ
jgi:hypothetical protein